MYEDDGLGLFLSREFLAITGLTIKESGVCGKGGPFRDPGAERKITGGKTGTTPEVKPFRLLHGGHPGGRFITEGLFSPDMNFFLKNPGKGKHANSLYI